MIPRFSLTDTISAVIHALVEAFVLVAIVVFLFLGNLRATIIPIIAIPVSLVGSFVILLALGYSANTVSLLALVLAVGIVVDDAIVVVENVERVMEEEPDLSPADATKKAMTQVTAPIVGITLVLLSVFVPIAFISGISGELFRQFAVTISASVLISAVNALTLSPALCTVFLRHSPRRGIMGRIGQGIDKVRDGYATIVRKTLRLSIISMVLVAAFGLGIFGLMKITPTGFLPEEDQGAFFINVQLPDGASVNRTSEAVKQVETILKSMPQVQDTISIIGFSLLDSYSASNNAFLIVKLKPFEDRTKAADSAQALIAHVFGAAQQIRTANVLPFNLPPVVGLSTTGGFEYQLENLEGADPKAMGAVVQGLVAAANQDPRLSRVFSTYGANAPSIFLDIDREKAQSLGITLSDVFTTLQTTLGGYFINNFNLFGRTWQVNLQAEAADRRDVSALWKIFIRNSKGCDGAAAVDCVGAYRHRTASDHAVQQLPLGDHQWQPGSGRGLGYRIGRHGRGVGQDAAAWLCVRMDRYRLSGARRKRPDPDRARAWRCCSHSCFWSRSTRAGSSRFRCCSPWWLVCSVRLAAS